MSRFLRDVRDGNLAAVQRHLVTNPSAVRATEPGTEKTALHIAAANRQLEVLRELLAASAPVDAKDSAGNVPLHTAVHTGDAAVVAELLGRGAKVAVKAKNNFGATPLHSAAKLGHLRIARELLAVGARADARDQRGKLPMDVVPRGSEELAELLRHAAAEGRAPGSLGSASPSYTRPTSASAAGTRTGGISPGLTPTAGRSLVPSRGPAAPRTALGYGSATLGAEVVADQLEKQAAAQRSQEKKVQQLNTKVDNLDGVLEAQRAAVEQREAALAALHSQHTHSIQQLQVQFEEQLRQLQQQQTEAMQAMQSSTNKRHEQLAQEVRGQVGKLDARVAQSEGRAAGQLGALDALQIQVESLEARLGNMERSGLKANGYSGGAVGVDVLRKVEAVERRLGAAEKQRALDRQRDLDCGRPVNASFDDLTLEAQGSPTSVTAFPGGAEAQRTLKKQAEVISGLQKGLASLESRLLDYHETMAIVAAAEAESPDYMTNLRAVLEPATSEAGSGSGLSADSTAVASRTSEQSSAAMGAVLNALEGLTKEVARVRVRTAQLGDRGHTSDMRLTYVEDQVAKIKGKMKQLRGWFTLSDSREKSEPRSPNQKSRSGLTTEAVHRSGFTERGVRHSASTGMLRSQQSLPASAMVLPITFD